MWVSWLFPDNKTKIPRKRALGEPSQRVTLWACRAEPSNQEVEGPSERHVSFPLCWWWWWWGTPGLSSWVLEVAALKASCCCHNRVTGCIKEIYSSRIIFIDISPSGTSQRWHLSCFSQRGKRNPDKCFGKGLRVPSKREQGGDSLRIIVILSCWNSRGLQVIVHSHEKSQ